MISKPKKASDLPPRTKPSLYPKPFAELMQGRTKRILGDAFGLKNYGVNFTSLEPGAISALHHQHTRQDEMIFILEGNGIVHVGEEHHSIQKGMVMGFPAGGPAHHLENTGDQTLIFLEIGDRHPEDEVFYPNDDLKAVRVDGKLAFTRKDGTKYDE